MSAYRHGPECQQSCGWWLALASGTEPQPGGLGLVAAAAAVAMTGAWSCNAQRPICLAVRHSPWPQQLLSQANAWTLGAWTPRIRGQRRGLCLAPVQHRPAFWDLSSASPGLLPAILSASGTGPEHHVSTQGTRSQVPGPLGGC